MLRRRIELTVGMLLVLLRVLAVVGWVVTLAWAASWLVWRVLGWPM